MSDFQEIESLPNSRQAEEAVIGSVLIYSEAYHEASKHINSDDFYVMRNQWIWDALGNLIRAHKPVDLLTLSEELESKDKLSEVGGQAYLLSLINATPSAMHAAEYAKEILEYSIRRTAIQSAHELVKLAYNTRVSISEGLPKFLSGLMSIKLSDDKTEQISVGLSALYEDIKTKSENPKDVYGIPTGIPTFDTELGGGQKKTMLILSGMPGAGKSVLKNQIAFNMAASAPGAIYELEMNKLDTLRRVLSADSGVKTRTMQTGRVDGTDWLKIDNTIDKLEKLPIYMSDSTSWTTASLRSDLTRLKHLYNIQWFSVDYMGLLKDRVGKDEPEREGIIAESLHDIIKDLDLFGIIVQSMTKEGFKGQGGMAGVAGGSKTHHTGEIITILEKESDESNVVYWNFEKNRNGDTPINRIKLQWKTGYPCFQECAK